MTYPTFREKKEKETALGYAFIDRQNTKWAHEIKDKCDHDWKPVQIALSEAGQPDLSEARVYCVCMKCCSHTYIVTAWAGYFIGSPDLLEEPE